MPAISKIRLTNIIYENGGKRFNDDIFEFDGHNGVILLENGGGKTVLIQTALQAVIPNLDLGERKIRDTLSLEGGAAHIAIEWILNDRPRRYGVTAVTLYLAPEGLKSLRYAYDYSSGDDNSIENIPFTKKNQENLLRSSSRQEIQEYYQYMQSQKLNAHSFDTIKRFHEYIEENFHIIPSEWKNIALINGAEGDVEKFFEQCKTTSQLVDKLFIPIVEESLAGNGTDDFVKIFEKQREHFKKHKDLRMRIEESKKIEEKISNYVSIYTKYHEIEEKMLNKKGELKFIYEFLEEEERKARSEIFHIENLQEILNKEMEELNRKSLSYELAKIEKELNKSKEEYEIILHEYNEIKQGLEEKEGRLQNLEIAELKSDIKQEEERITRLINQLNELDDDYETLDLKDRLIENSGILKGFFEQELNSLEKQKNVVNSQKDKYKEELNLTYTKLESLQMEKERLTKNSIRFETEINITKKSIESIKKEILLNSINETVEGEYPKWKERLEEIEKLNLEHIDYLKSLRNKKHLLSKEIPLINNEIQDLIKDATIEEKDLEEIHTKQEKILSMIRNLKIDWQYLDSIYLKQQSIIQYIDERLVRIKGEKERLIEKERLSYRLLDYYGENEYFTGEPLLENWIDSWKNQFNLLEIGTKYIEKIADEFNKDIETLYIEYPLWPLVAITTDREIDKLYKKIESQNKKLIYPILVISQDEATKIILGKTNIKERYIYPSIWQENIDKKKFQIWKEELLLTVKKIVEERKNKEKEEKDWEDRLKNINEFLINYPYDKYCELEESQRELKKKLEDTRNTLAKKQIEYENTNNEINEYEDKSKNVGQESNYLEKKVEKALEFFQEKRKIEEIQKQLFVESEKVDKVNKNIELNKKNIKISEDIVKSIEWEVGDINDQMSKILDDSNYKEVKDFKIIYKDMEKESILEDRKYINEMLSKKQKDRPSLEEELKVATINKEKRIKSLELKYKSAHYFVDETLGYPYNGKDLMRILIENIIILRENMKKIEPKKNKKREIFNDNSTKYNIRETDFHEIFDEIMSFTDPLFIVEKQINEEKVELEEKEKYLKTNFDRLKKEVKEIEGHIQKFQVENGKYEFLVNKVKPILLQPDKVQNLPYNRKTIISSIIVEMEELKISLEDQSKLVNMEKNRFIQFLNENPIEIRLKEMAISGVRNKEDFNDILEWQSNMERTLNRVVKIYEKNMIEHDRELNQFIQYLYTYLSTLAYEISTIPKNTKIKIEDKWKEIYQIQVPSWNEDRGKEEIRKHVDWMIGKLEDGEFLDEEGNEDVGKVNKSIETWLKPKQLLNIIMLGEEINVRCRKVTNDGKISNMYHSWSSSNKWSGGEKWSKNMALFLGILNYAAEKKQHIVPNQKRNRTVIMDNPFGKASSDHVLSPVFFIAEQLGFQFIVLTAHGDGRYIRDYFPIVYSCRLRPSVKGDTSILTKEKIINYAFFRDNDPMTIERIGDREQLNLLQ